MITTFACPSETLTGGLIVIEPVFAPVVGTVPEPTFVPSISILQSVGPLAARRRQKLNEVMDTLYPVATLNVNVFVWVPALTMEIDNAFPDAPGDATHDPEELVQDEEERLLSNTPVGLPVVEVGDRVYGIPYGPSLKLCR